MSTYIIIPAYNEEKNISSVLKELLKYNYHIVVVDDGSSDKTSHIVNQYPVWLLKHTLNRGQGAALDTGTRFALQQGAEYIVHFDGDGQFLAQEIKNILQPLLEKKADITLGSRYLKQNIHTPWLKKYLIHPVAKLINHFFTKLKLTDAHCGFRALNANAAQKISISQDGMSHNTEIVAQIKPLNLRHQEIPVTVIYHQFGQGIAGGFKIIKELILAKIKN